MNGQPVRPEGYTQEAEPTDRGDWQCVACGVTLRGYDDVGAAAPSATGGHYLACQFCSEQPGIRRALDLLERADAREAKETAKLAAEISKEDKHGLHHSPRNIQFGGESPKDSGTDPRSVSSGWLQDHGQ